MEWFHCNPLTEGWGLVLVVLLTLFQINPSISIANPIKIREPCHEFSSPWQFRLTVGQGCQLLAECCSHDMRDGNQSFLNINMAKHRRLDPPDFWPLTSSLRELSTSPFVTSFPWVFAPRRLRPGVIQGECAQLSFICAHKPLLNLEHSLSHSLQNCNSSQPIKSVLNLPPVQQQEGCAIQGQPTSRWLYKPRPAKPSDLSPMFHMECHIQVLRRQWQTPLLFPISLGKSKTKTSNKLLVLHVTAGSEPRFFEHEPRRSEVCARKIRARIRRSGDEPS